jgi:hypothetical protein
MRWMLVRISTLVIIGGVVAFEMGAGLTSHALLMGGVIGLTYELKGASFRSLLINLVAFSVLGVLSLGLGMWVILGYSLGLATVPLLFHYWNSYRSKA